MCAQGGHTGPPYIAAAATSKRKNAATILAAPFLRQNDPITAINLSARIHIPQSQSDARAVSWPTRVTNRLSARMVQQAQSLHSRNNVTAKRFPASRKNVGGGPACLPLGAHIAAPIHASSATVGARVPTMPTYEAPLHRAPFVIGEALKPLLTTGREQ